MPAVHTLQLPVRSYEIDAYGHVNQTQYLRYLQEAAFQHSTAMGYDPARYEALNTFFIIRETEIEYLNALRYGDTVEIRTWGERYRRVQPRRRYDLFRAGTGEPVARAATEWVYVDRTTRRPTPMPDEMIALFWPDPAERQPDESPRTKYPDAPPAPPAPFTMRRTVEWRDIDEASIVNNAVYLSYMEESGVQAATQYGWPLARMTGAGFAIMARRHHIEYRESAVLGDELDVTTYLFEPKRSTISRYYEVRRTRDNALLARSRSTFMCVDIKSSSLMRIPEHVMADFSQHVSQALVEGR